MAASNGFPSIMRLHKTDEFSSVFNNRCSTGGVLLQILVKPNNQSNPRLGIVVSRKISKRAVDRNYIKRSLREYFRLHQHQYNNFDFVVRVKKFFDSRQLEEMHNEFAKLVNGLENVTHIHFPD